MCCKIVNLTFNFIFFNVKNYLYILIFVVFIGCSKQEKITNAGIEMQNFVVNICQYCRSIKPNFILIPQNGIEVCFENIDPLGQINQNYINSIDAVGVEELFYNGKYLPDDYRIDMLTRVVKHKSIMVSEQVENKNEIARAYELNQNEGFLCFVRDKNNYYYEHIPDTIVNSNNNDITKMSDVKNFLYLIGGGKGSDKLSFLNSIASTNYDLVIIDLFFDDIALNSDDLNRIKYKANGAKRLIIAYMSIGSAEKYRYYWQSNWRKGNPSFIAKSYKGYPDEYWVKFWDKDWQNIIYGNDNSYVKKIIDAGFDGVFLDNIGAYYFLYKN